MLTLGSRIPPVFPLAVIAVVTGLGCCGCPNLPRQQADTTGTNKSGTSEQPSKSERSLSPSDHAIVASDKLQEVLAATDDEADDELHKLARAKDKQGVQQMLLSGKALLVPVGTKVLVIRPRVFTVEARILEGDHEGKRAFFDKEFLKKAE